MNGRSRTPLVGVLLAAEVAILGLAAYSVRGAFSGNAFAGGGMGGADFVAKTFAPIAAGSTPRVTIDDPNSGVTISASPDGLVHVKDDTYFSGALLRNPNDYPQLTVTRDFNGVHISRPRYHEGWAMFIGFSNSRQHFEVQVPANAAVTVDECDNAEVSDLQNGVTIKALDGRIELTHVEGAIVAHTDDGHVSVDGVKSPSLDLSSNDGWIEVHNFTAAGSAPYVRLQSSDGHIAANGEFAAGGRYDVATKDGRINVAFAHGSDVTVDASTNDGSLRVDGTRQSGDDGAQQSIHVGNGTSTMRVHTDDGSITLTTDGSN
jgi:Putative adhesin